jgi:hypothetical protein
VGGSEPTRLGGRTHLPGGDVVVWSVADGRRGRRWRESTARGGVGVRTILVETGPDGEVRRLEMSSPVGLLTVHPDEPGTTLHGNVVTPDGIRHLAFAWGPDRVIVIGGSPAATAIAVAWLGREAAAGRSADVTVLRIDDRLIPELRSATIERLGPRSWRLSGIDEFEGEIVATLDPDGLLATDRTVWPLEP